MSLSAMVCLERCMKSLVLYFCDHQLYVCSLSLQTATKNFQLLAKFQVPFGQVHQNIEVLIAWVDSIILLYLEVGASEDERKEKKKPRSHRSSVMRSMTAWSNILTARRRWTFQLCLGELQKRKRILTSCHRVHLLSNREEEFLPIADLLRAKEKSASPIKVFDP